MYVFLFFGSWIVVAIVIWKLDDRRICAEQQNCHRDSPSLFRSVLGGVITAIVVTVGFFLVFEKNVKTTTIASESSANSSALVSNTSQPRSSSSKASNISTAPLSGKTILENVATQMEQLKMDVQWTRLGNECPLDANSIDTRKMMGTCYEIKIGKARKTVKIKGFKPIVVSDVELNASNKGDQIVALSFGFFIGEDLKTASSAFGAVMSELKPGDTTDWQKLLPTLVKSIKAKKKDESTVNLGDGGEQIRYVFSSTLQQASFLLVSSL